MTIYSLNEIEAHCKKAVRGAGYSWGHAEEAGKGMRWLATYRLPGVELLAEYLTARDTNPESFQSPYSVQSDRQSDPDGVLCPLLSGASFVDSAPEGQLSLSQVAWPLLLTPWLVFSARSQNQAIEFGWENSRLQFQGDRLIILNDNDLLATRADSVFCKPTTIINSGSVASRYGQETDQSAWEILSRFALRTYVPATEASRRGAGPAE